VTPIVGMSQNDMRLLSIPATLVGIAVAILFFKVYGVFTRPDVPWPVAIIVNQFAPGVSIGSKVADARHAVAAMTYVPHLGFVGIPGSRGSNLPNGYSVKFSQVRLLLDEETRRLPNPDPAKARIDAVEIVSGDPSAASDIGQALTMTFRTAPRQGCLRTSDEDRVRDVQVWPTPNERGGLALISDHRATVADRERGPQMTSVIGFVGKFDGGRTLRGNYTDASCLLVLQSQ
jgi:hypothetical protein